MIFTSVPGWDEIGNVVMAIGTLAIVAYLVTGMTPLPSPWQRRLQMVAVALLAIALILALAAAAMWFAK